MHDRHTVFRTLPTYLARFLTSFVGPLKLIAVLSFGLIRSFLPLTWSYAGF